MHGLSSTVRSVLLRDEIFHMAVVESCRSHYHLRVGLRGIPGTVGELRASLIARPVTMQCNVSALTDDSAAP